MFYILFMSLLLISLSILFLIRRKEKFLNIVMKVLVIIFMILTFVNVFLPDSFVYSYSEEELVGNNKIFEAFIRWFRYVGFLVIPIAIFKNKKVINKIAIYFSLPIAIINLVMYFIYLPEFTTTNIRGIANIRFLGEGFRSFISNDIFRSSVFGVISLLEIVILLYILFKNYKNIMFDSIKEIFTFIITLFSLILLIIPIYIPQYIIGYTNIIFESYSIGHLIWVLALVLEFTLLNTVFKNKSNEDKYILVLIMSMALLIQYNQMFSAINELTFERLPLQLCNIGSYLILITLLTKCKKLFSFTLIVNVVGGLIALSVMDVDGKGIGYLWNMHFILEHSSVVIIPLLCLSLKLFPPIKKIDIVYVLGGFLIYFITVLNLGTQVNSVYKLTGNDFFEANYLFMFDKVKAENLVSVFGKLFETEINIGNYTYYPVIQSAVFFTFSALCVGIFYLLYGITHIKKIKEVEVN